MEVDGDHERYLEKQLKFQFVRHEGEQLMTKYSYKLRAKTWVDSIRSVNVIHAGVSGACRPTSRSSEEGSDNLLHCGIKDLLTA